MNDSDVFEEKEKSIVEDEVDSIFQKTQIISQDIDEPYDFYVPFAVQIESEYWDSFLPADILLEEGKQAREDAGVIIPASRVKKLMKMDPDVNIVSKKAVQMMSKATTLFIDTIAQKLNDWMQTESTKTIKNHHVIQVCKQSHSLWFLLEDLTLEEHNNKRVKVAKPKVDTEKEKSVSDGGISRFFGKSV